ncbi:glycosyltransferase [Aliiglaciecola sp. 3_MG-2023]|uniref:glycosyltransferase n=1 Tax=Aliiglaciecola sp. 3_MG-2023 TaxID=3062644 RepID=UPI0026E2665D|nr:glycosyltransferase [Aliiglaciecola sp. 3_MG-2023]MDO6693227.1 glycosyltransferase [Aliiglaciecola sp. 3_MG-2023]
MKKKIYFLINGFGKGGAQRQCVYLLNQLQKNLELEVHLIYFYEGFYFHLLETEGLILHKINYSSFYDPRNIARISSILPNDKVILFSWLRSSDFYAYFLKKIKSNILWIMAERNSKYPDSFLFNLRKKFAKKANHIITNSEKGASYWCENRIQNVKISLIENAFIQEKGKNDYFNDDKCNIVYAGRLEEQKNIIRTAEFLSKYVSKRKSVNLHIFGEGSQEDVVKEIFSEYLGSQVFMKPFEEKISDIFTSTDVFISLSKYEGMPNSVVENAALGNKMLLSDIDEHKNIVGRKYKYLLPIEFDINESCLMLDNLISAPVESIKFEHIEEIMAKCTLEKVANQYFNIFCKVLNNYDN